MISTHLNVQYIVYESKTWLKQSTELCFGETVAMWLF